MKLNVFPGQIGGGVEPMTFVVQTAQSGVGLSTFSGVQIQFNTASGTGVGPLKAVTDSNGNATFVLKADSFSGQVLTAVAFDNAPSPVATTPFQSNSISYYANIMHNLFQAFAQVPRYEEPMLISENGQSAKAGWGKWNYDPMNPPVIMKNTEIWLENSWIDGNGYVIDYLRGMVYFQSPMLPGDDLRISYNFSLLRPEDYIPYLQMALSTLNMKCPQTFFEFTNAPGANSIPMQWLGTLIQGAYSEAAKALLMRMNTFAYRRLWEDPNYITDQLRANSQEAQHQFELQIAQKRRGYATAASIKSWNQGVPWQTNESNFLALTVLGSPTLTN